MARTWEYSRWRHIAMQAVLCAALGASVALAMWVDRSRAAALATKIGPTRLFRNNVCSLNLRLPENWRVITESERNLAFVRAVEQESRFGIPRAITLLLTTVQQSASSPSPEDAAVEILEKLVLKGRRAEGPARPLDFLGVHGALVEFPAEQFIDPETGVAKVRTPVAAACAVLPEASCVVIVYMNGPQTLAPADYDLLRAIAASLGVPDPNHPAPLLSGNASDLGGPRLPRDDAPESDDPN